MSRAAIYARLSLADEKSTSTERQKKDCRDHAKSLGLEVVAEFTDEGISGFKDVERPEFDRAIDGLVRGDFDTLIVWKLDRLTRRGMGHIGTLLDRLDGSGRRIISKMDGVDTSQSQGRIMVALLSEMARSESQNTSIRLKAQRADAKERGRMSQGSPPWGMMTLEDGTVAPDPEMGHIAREAIEKVLAGEKRLAVVRWLNTNGHLTRRGALWSEASFSRWIMSPTLAGFVSTHSQGDFYAEPYRSTETGEFVVIGEGLITEAEYFNLRALLKSRNRSTTKRGRKSSAMLSGLATCERCGSTIYGAGRYYYCPGSRKGICGSNKISRHRTEEVLGDLVISRICAMEMGCDVHLRIENVWRGDGSDHVQVVSTAADEMRLDQLRDRMTALMEDRYSKGAFTGQEQLFDRLREDLQGQIAEQEAKIQKHGSDRGGPSQMDLSDAEIVREAWAAASDKDRNAVSKIVIESISLSPKNHTGQDFFDPTRLEINWLAA